MHKQVENEEIRGCVELQGILTRNRAIIQPSFNVLTSHFSVEIY